MPWVRGGDCWWWAPMARGVDVLYLSLKTTWPSGVEALATCAAVNVMDVVVVLFVGALTGVWSVWDRDVVSVAQCCHRQLWQCKGLCGHTFLETSTHAFSIFSNGFSVFMFDLLLFQCFPEVGRGRFGPSLCHSLPWRW
jgi:hypothetical protein